MPLTYRAEKANKSMHVSLYVYMPEFWLTRSAHLELPLLVEEPQLLLQYTDTFDHNVAPAYPINHFPSVVKPASEGDSVAVTSFVGVMQ
jgi:hypothetical protein